jgi:hypothetical protein
LLVSLVLPLVRNSTLDNSAGLKPGVQ